MRGLSMAVLIGLALAGCGPEKQEPDGTTPGSGSSGATPLAADCKFPFPESSIPADRKWDPPNHYGVDFPQPAGADVDSVAAGEVAKVGVSSCLGNYVVVRHSHDGKFSAYSHLSEQTVKAGDPVQKGGKVGKVGSTGTCSTGPHLHLTMSNTDTGFMEGNTMDPLKYIHGCS